MDGFFFSLIFYLIWQFVTSYNWVHSKSLRLWPFFFLFILLSIIAWIYVVGFFRQNFRRIDAIELVQRRFDFRLEFVLTYCAFVDAYSIAYQWFYLTCSNLRHILLFHLLSTEKIVWWSIAETFPIKLQTPKPFRIVEIYSARYSHLYIIINFVIVSCSQCTVA